MAPADRSGTVAAINPGGASSQMPAQAAGAALAALGMAPQSAESDAEIRVLRRRVDQLQTELRMYRTQKFKEENVRRMEDLENDLSMMEIERDNLKSRLDKAEQSMKLEAGSIKVKRALEIASMTAETAAQLNDLLSSLRIEVMAAEGEFEQYAHQIARASFELIRQSLKDAASHCDEARELLRKLREVAE